MFCSTVYNNLLIVCRALSTVAFPFGVIGRVAKRYGQESPKKLLQVLPEGTSKPFAPLGQDSYRDTKIGNDSIHQFLGCGSSIMVGYWCQDSDFRKIVYEGYDNSFALTSGEDSKDVNSEGVPEKT